MQKQCWGHYVASLLLHVGYLCRWSSKTREITPPAEFSHEKMGYGGGRSPSSHHGAVLSPFGLETVPHRLWRALENAWKHIGKSIGSESEISQLSQIRQQKDSCHSGFIKVVLYHINACWSVWIGSAFMHAQLWKYPCLAGIWVIWCQTEQTEVLAHSWSS